VRRVLARIDADALDRAIGAWLAAQQPPPAGPSPPGRPPRRAVAVDGKTLRGTGHHGNPQVHLLAVMDHTSRRVLGQTDVQATTNEIARFRPLLDGLDLTDTVVTADALHTQREHADWLVTQKHSASLLVVKHNQPTLHHQLRRLPWRAIPVADHTRDRGHGRAELRRLQVTTVAGLDFPHAAQALRITRRVRFGGKEGLYHALSELWLRQEATLVHPESTLQDLLVAYLQASFDDPRMTRLLLWTGLASSAAPHERPPSDPNEREDLSDMQRRQAEGEIADDLDPGLFQLAMMGAIVAPIAMPQVVRRITGRSPDDPQFQAHYSEQLRRIVRHLARNGTA
jgi:predicted transposase YbfD/YdcC/AcrR family transcriptional regulator